jgi:hypothetical protein
MTLAEILAGARAGQAVGIGATGADLSITAERERRSIEEAQRSIREQAKYASDKAKKRERRRGVGRLIGGTLGFLAGGSAGKAVGSAIGQGLASAGHHGEVAGVRSGLGAGMFFSGAREDISAYERDTNRFISDANRGYKAKILTDVVGDYLTGRRMEQAGITKEAFQSIPGFARSTDAEGNVLGLRRGIQSAFKAEGSRTGTTIGSSLANFLTGGEAGMPETSLLDFLPKDDIYTYGSRGIGSAIGDMGDLSNYGVTVTGIRG